MELISIICAMLEWRQDRQFSAFSLEQLYANLLSALKNYPHLVNRFAAEFQKLDHTPQGRQMALDLHELDRLWGNKLESLGITFDPIIRERKVHT